MGSDLWEETLNDMVQETCFEAFSPIGRKDYWWSVYKRVPEPENKDEVLAEVRSSALHAVKYIQKIGEKMGKRFIISDTVRISKILIDVFVALCRGSFLDGVFHL